MEPDTTGKPVRLCIKCGKNPARERRRVCRCCEIRQWRERHPVKAAFFMLKWSAHLRGIAWELSFEDFCLFNDITGYVEKKGLNGDSLTVDRIREDGPYSLSNIQPLSRSLNSTKGNHFYHNRQKQESKPPAD